MQPHAPVLSTDAPSGSNTPVRLTQVPGGRRGTFPVWGDAQSPESSDSPALSLFRGSLPKVCWPHLTIDGLLPKQHSVKAKILIGAKNLTQVKTLKAYSENTRAHTENIRRTHLENTQSTLIEHRGNTQRISREHSEQTHRTLHSDNTQRSLIEHP